MDEFKATHPDITVQLIPVVGDGYYRKLLTMAAAGELPDVFVLNYTRIPDFTKHNLLADVSTLPAKLEARGIQPNRGALAAYIELGRRSGATGLRVLPREWSPAGLLALRTDLLPQKALPSPLDSLGWQALPQLAKAAEQPKPFAFGVYSYGLLPWLYQAGGGLVDAEGRLALDSPANRKALKTLTAFVFEHKISPSPDPKRDESTEQFLAGACPIALVGTYAAGLLATKLEPDQWRLLPPLTGEKQATCAVSTGFALSSKCANPGAAETLMLFLAERGGLLWAEAGLAFPAFTYPQPVTFASGRLPDGGAEVISTAARLAQAPDTPLEPGYEELLSLLREHLEVLFLEQGAVDEELQKAQKEALASIERDTL